MIKEIYTWFGTVIDHALSLWIVFVVVTAVWVSTAWAVKRWLEWYQQNGKSNCKCNDVKG